MFPSAASPRRLQGDSRVASTEIEPYECGLSFLSPLSSDTCTGSCIRAIVSHVSDPCDASAVYNPCNCGRRFLERPPFSAYTDSCMVGFISRVDAGEHLPLLGVRPFRLCVAHVDGLSTKYPQPSLGPEASASEGIWRGWVMPSTQEAPTIAERL